MKIPGIERVAVIGLGLMGASLGRALKQRQFAGSVSGYARREETRQAAVEQGVVDVAVDHLLDAVSGADLVVLCTPILTIPALVEKLAGSLKSGAILTDVGSTKKDLRDRLAPLLAPTGALYVGSHPMCGSEQQGIEFSRADLYEGAVVAVIPPATGPVEPLDQVEKFWQSVGAVTRRMSAEDHDRWVARTSHLPHLLASLLVAVVAREGVQDEISSLCGSGFADTSRVAEGSASVWHDIIKTNKSAIREELSAMDEQLQQFMQMLDKDDSQAIEEFLEQGRINRIALLQQKAKHQHGT